MIEVTRNPTWTRDELILALDFYFKNRGRIPDANSKEVQTLSNEISAIARNLGLTGADNFRNTNGVYMKLGNFRRLDPTYTSEGRRGLTRGGKGDEDVWNEFADNLDKLGKIARLIRSSLEEWILYEDRGPSLTEDIAEATEGRVYTRLHRLRERNRKIVERKKDNFQKKSGRVFCEACGFDFGRVYGARGENFIECHHLKPIHEMGPGETTRLEDLVLLCANCHRMIHVETPWLTFEGLKEILRAG